MQLHQALVLCIDLCGIALDEFSQRLLCLLLRA
jgi:hypothetical protein